jgi:hypothetical protein
MPDDAVLRMVARLVDETSAPLKQMEKSFADFKRTADTEGTTTKFKGLGGAFKGVGDSINQVAAPALSSFGIKAGLSIAAVTGSMIGLTKAAVDYANTVSSLKNSAQILNMNAGSAINLDRAMRAVGVEGGIKTFRGVADDMLEIGQNIDGVRAKWAAAGLDKLFQQQYSFAAAGDSEKYIGGMIAHLKELQAISPALAAGFARDFLHTDESVGKIVAGWERAMAAPKMSDAESAKMFADAAKLKATMADFWTNWDKFYQQAMINLIPGIDKMMKGMAAGFEKMPEVWDRFLGSPAGKLLSKMLEAAVPKEDPKVDKEGNLKPPPELGPALPNPEDEREAQKRRNAAGGAIPSLFRAGQEVIDLLTTGKVKRRTETHEINVPIDKWIYGAVQGQGTNEAGGAADPFGKDAWKSYGETDAGKAPPSVRQQQPTDKPAFMRVPAQATGAGTPIVVPPKAPAADPFQFNPASGNVEYTEPPASGDDVKEGAKQGIIEGIGEWLARNALTPAGRSDLNIPEPRDVKRSEADIKAAADIFGTEGGDEVDAYGGAMKKAVEPYSQPPPAAPDKSSEATQRITDQINYTQSPSVAMKSLVEDRSQRQEDDKFRQRLMQPPVLGPNIDQITQALGAANKVEGSATLTVDIAAPQGTKATIDADGLFGQTEMKRRRAFQMEKTMFNDGFDN